MLNSNQFIYISFSSRNSLFSFQKLLSNIGVRSNVVNTPKAITQSCSLSLKSHFSNYNLIISALNKLRPTDFLGIYIYKQSLKGNIIEKIY